MITASASALQPGGWQAEWREAITDPDQLLLALDLAPLRQGSYRPDRGQFPLRVPRAFVARMRRGDPLDPLLRQVLPLDAELQPQPGFATDAVGDLASSAAPGVLHKYAGRVLLITTGSCAINCRYCFRRHFPYAEELAAREHWGAALDYLRAHPEVTEVILSGGDPLSLSTAKLAELTGQLAQLPQIRRLRIHTRLPIVLPNRVDAELHAWLTALPWPVAVVVHVNHPNELDRATAAALRRLSSAGVRLYNQTVLLAGVNDNADGLIALSESLYDLGVSPYYLHLLDRVAGTAHFEVESERAALIHEQMRRRLPGYLVPQLVRELAGAPYKVPASAVG